MRLCCVVNDLTVEIQTAKKTKAKQRNSWAIPEAAVGIRIRTTAAERVLPLIPQGPVSRVADFDSC
jgi:hypothetical protein